MPIDSRESLEPSPVVFDPEPLTTTLTYRDRIKILGVLFPEGCPGCRAYPAAFPNIAGNRPIHGTIQ